MGPVVGQGHKRGRLRWRNVPPSDCFLSSHQHLFTRNYRAIAPAKPASPFLCAIGEMREVEKEIPGLEAGRPLGHSFPSPDHRQVEDNIL